jgi:hypothetical protein
MFARVRRLRARTRQGIHLGFLAFAVAGVVAELVGVALGVPALTWTGAAAWLAGVGGFIVWEKTFAPTVAELVEETLREIRTKWAADLADRLADTDLVDGGEK